ncbi:uncharacterized protein LOC133886885 [Phragmites australis]|uniref:uncharacterized protein LOC133886885 n=1 Tax=Phragmites australis TaxID=29695 RepID=UPI002D78452A|nr:uncharacterized protein LOC133886885 [Phragmites australis]
MDPSESNPWDEEHRPSEVSSSELGRAITDLPTFEVLSVSDSRHLTPETADEYSDDDYAEDEEHPSKVSSAELGRAVTDVQTFEKTEETDDDDASSHLRKPGDLYTISPKGLTRSMLLSLGDSLLTTVSVVELCRTDSDVEYVQYHYLLILTSILFVC